MSRRQRRLITPEIILATFSPDDLQRVCEAPAADFTAYAQRFDLPSEGKFEDRFFYYKDNGSNILGVAHLDTVQKDRSTDYYTLRSTGQPVTVLSGALDDRLGAYIILEWLPRLGIRCDWLLTTDEESCHSTADEFTTDKQYRWMFSFDRGGQDVVMYHYETPGLVRMVNEVGGKVGTGSFSDICRLDHLGCKGLNWGCGMMDYHSLQGYAYLSHTRALVAQFVAFYERHRNEYLQHTPGTGQRVYYHTDKEYPTLYGGRGTGSTGSHYYDEKGQWKSRASTRWDAEDAEAYERRRAIQEAFPGSSKTYAGTTKTREVTVVRTDPPYYGVLTDGKSSKGGSFWEQDSTGHVVLAPKSDLDGKQEQVLGADKDTDVSTLARPDECPKGHGPLYAGMYCQDCDLVYDEQGREVNPLLIS
jgi:hypothetical protein